MVNERCLIAVPGIGNDQKYLPKQLKSWGLWWSIGLSVITLFAVGWYQAVTLVGS